MANYKQVSAFCYHCQKQVVAKKEEVDNQFWLIASLFSCGVFAFFWIFKLLTFNPPSLCSQCGLAIGNNPNPPNVAMPEQSQPGRANLVPQNSDEATGKGLSPAAKGAIASVVGLIALIFLCRIFGDVASIANPKQAVTTPQTSQQSTLPAPKPVKTAKERQKWAAEYQARKGKEFANLKCTVSGKDNTTLTWKSEAAVHESAIGILNESGYYDEVFEQGFKKLILTDTSDHVVILTSK